MCETYLHQQEITPTFCTKFIIYGGNITMKHTHETEVAKSKGKRIGLLNTLQTGICFLYINHKSLIQSKVTFFLVNHALLPFFVALFIV
jgi:hypothetical protein